MYYKNTNILIYYKYNNISKSTIMQAEDSRTTNYMIARMFDFVDLNPCPIKHIYYSTNTCMLYIARNSYS